MNPIVSIITINYNNDSGLNNTIQSLINQTFRDFEFIVIDGASTDSSLEIIKIHKDNISYWVSEKDSGIYNAMNKGIKVATGNYLFFLNSGDVLNGASALQDFISHPDFVGDVIYGDYKFDEGGKVYPDHLTPLFFVKSSLPHQSTFFKKEVFQKMGFYDENYQIVSDRAFYIKCFFSNQFQFKHVNFELTVFDLSGISNNENYLVKIKQESEEILSRYYGVFYADYKNMIFLQSQLNRAKEKTFRGILKRIVRKTKYLCHIR